MRSIKMNSCTPVTRGIDAAALAVVHLYQRRVKDNDRETYSPPTPRASPASRGGASTAAFITSAMILVLGFGVSILSAVPSVRMSCT
jgi:hypothetical protein